MIAPRTSWLAFVAGAALLAACSSSSSSLPAAAVPAGFGGTGSTCHGGGTDHGASSLALTSTVYYDPQIKEILNSYCVDCHSGTNAPDLGSYESVSAVAQASLTAMQNGSMPEGRPLGAGDVSTFQQWISGGQQNLMPLPSGTGTATGASTGATVTYYADVQPLLAKSCSSCHGAGGQSPDLSSYAAVKANLGAALTSIDGFSMPPSSAPALPNGAVATLQAWQSSNYVEGTASSSSSTQGGSSTCQ